MKGFPDWSDANQYPKESSDWTYTQWAWEFLRRNQSYQSEFIETQNIPDGADKLCRSFEVARKYDLAVGMLNPFEVTAWKLPDESIFVRYPRFSVNEVDLFAPFKVSLTFDISLPLDAQLREAKGMLELRVAELSKSKPRLFSKVPPLIQKRERIPFQKLVNYLRVLDADQAGAAEPEIAKELFPKLDNDSMSKYAGNVRVQNHLMAAKKLRDGAYRKLSLQGSDVYKTPGIEELQPVLDQQEIVNPK